MEGILFVLIILCIVVIISAIIVLIRTTKTKSIEKTDTVGQYKPEHKQVQSWPQHKVYKIVCPFCYEEFGVNDIRFRFDINNRVVYLPAHNNDEAANKFLRESGLEKTIYYNEGVPVTMELKRSDGMNMGSSPVRVCKNYACNAELSAEVGTYSPDNGIFMLGLKSSGKTVYITSVIEQLRQQIPFRFDCRFVNYNKAVGENYLENYFETMFVEKTLPEATIKPGQLTYEVIRPHPKKTIGITFSDIKGEIADNPQEIFNGDVSGAISHSNFYILTIDFKDIKADTKHRMMNSMIINNVLAGATADITQKDKKYLAVVITKSDELMGSDSIFDADSKIYDSNVAYYTEAFDRERAEINDMLRSYLKNDAAFAGIVTDAEGVFLPQNVNYFAVSALGQAPVDGKLENEIKPIRVEEPVLWLLKKSGIILN